MPKEHAQWQQANLFLRTIPKESFPGTPYYNSSNNLETCWQLYVRSMHKNTMTSSIKIWTSICSMIIWRLKFYKIIWTKNQWKQVRKVANIDQNTNGMKNQKVSYHSDPHPTNIREQKSNETLVKPISGSKKATKP